MSAVCCFNILFEFCVSLNWSCLFRRDLPNTNPLLASSLLGLQLWFCIFTISEFYNWGILRFIHTSFKRMLPFCGNIRHRENYCTAKFTAKKCQMQNKRKKQRIFFVTTSRRILLYILELMCLVYFLCNADLIRRLLFQEICRIFLRIWPKWAFLLVLGIKHDIVSPRSPASYIHWFVLFSSWMLPPTCNGTIPMLDVLSASAHASLL